MGVGIGAGVGLGLEGGFGVGDAIGFGVGVADGLGLGLAIGLGVGLASGFGVEIAIVAVGLGSGDTIGSRDGVGIGSKIGVAFGWSVKVSVDSNAGVGRDLGGVDSAAGDGPLFLKGVEAASWACTKGVTARKTVASASKRMVFFKLFPSGEFVRSEASALSLTRSSRIDSCSIAVRPAVTWRLQPLR